MNDRFKREFAQITSRKGAASATYERGVFVPCPGVLPEGWTPARWAREAAGIWWGVSGLPHDEGDLEKLTTLLQFVYDSTWGPDSTIPCHVAYIHLPDPRMLPLPVYLAVLEAMNPEEEELRRLTLADDPAVIKPPVVEDFMNEQLGRGLKVLRYWRGAEEGEVDAGLGYAWRSAEFETDVRLFTATNDHGRLLQAVPDIDRLAQKIEVFARPPD